VQEASLSDRLSDIGSELGNATSPPFGIFGCITVTNRYKALSMSSYQSNSNAFSSFVVTLSAMNIAQNASELRE
jgi:hypothetical protein